ncbi:MAG: hypothetical protein KC635_05810, partial [Myxococcales bacterium]|nr:hypothetical protein [Myxococcales bacterium]
CVGCHLGDYQTAEPDHVERGFDTNCVTCHTVAAWKPATFDHDQFWPLTGKHLTATCESCHVGGVYAGTPRDCEGCHRTDYDATTRPAHASVGIPANCTQCHDTDDWHTSTFPQHDRLFPITSGRHRNFGCADCHADAGDYSVFTCTGCHTGEHEISRMNRKHQGEVSGYQSTLDQYGVERGCYHCHPDGRADD